MSVVAVVSMKGGVGKTSVTANLAAAMAARLGAGRVSVIDLDPQDALHWHLGIAQTSEQGVCLHSVQGLDWRAGLAFSEFDVACLPYGAVTEAQRENFESLLLDEPSWIGDCIAQAGLDDDALVLIDTPPGPSVYLKQAFACADLVLIVVLADAGSYATIPAMETWISEISTSQALPRCVYVLNQLDRSEALNRDVADTLQAHLGARLVQVRVHRDEAVGEALAFQQPVLVYDPHGQASHDLARLAGWVIDALS